ELGPEAEVLEVGLPGVRWVLEDGESDLVHVVGVVGDVVVISELLGLYAELESASFEVSEGGRHGLLEGDVPVLLAGILEAVAAVGVSSADVEARPEAGVELSLSRDRDVAGEGAEEEIGREVIRAEACGRPGVGKGGDVAAVVGGWAPVLIEGIACKVGGVG